MQFSITLYTAFFILCMLTIASLVGIVATFYTDSHQAAIFFLDLRTLMTPRDAMAIPIPTTPPNSPFAADGMLLFGNARIIPTPITIKAPPIMIKIPKILDGSLRVMKNETMSRIAGINPNIMPLDLASM